MVFFCDLQQNSIQLRCITLLLAVSATEFSCWRYTTSRRNQKHIQCSLALFYYTGLATGFFYP